ncbi:hypothetical protein FIBSPDRAFT_1038987 [Athelia psychrophila]|uniref:BTB domain-containing protein n=1 Tax=Athelia psychrophila TaxID=1759441 RepID=A0A166SDG5_9AGAM|nr:hypothetical protein FIBSPDRAFT_1038987 [Fibularhizoctonia sp. CBS 109695]
MSTPSQPEVNRKGTDEPETATDSSIVRSEIWFHDGNIVLQAGRTQFKIYQGLLSANSTVFADMFSIPQPPLSGGDLVEGCAVIHLSDSAVDVTYVLEALCKRSHVTIDEPVSISVVAAFVRLGQKYQIDAVLSEALKRLYNEFPVELKNLDDKRYDWDKISYSKGINIDVANLAREQNLLSVLPYALHLCCYVRSDVTMQGVQRKDNTIAKLAPINERAVLAASHSILLLQSSTTFSWLTADGSDECDTHQDCNNGRNQILRDSFFPLPIYTCLATWAREWEENMCGACVLKAQDFHAVGRQKYWDELPSTFGLPDWEELKKERVLSNI